MLNLKYIWGFPVPKFVDRLVVAFGVEVWLSEVYYVD